jgi:branched-chain amino acid aminotransferase
MEEMVYFNGRLIPRQEARVSVLDYGFLFGYGLYETLRAYHGRLFRLDGHLERLARGADELGIRLDLVALRQGVLDTVNANGFPETRVRITVSIGEGTMTPDLRSCGIPTVVVLAGEYHPFAAEKYGQGFSAVVSSIRRNSRSPVTFMKSANGMESMIARQQARQAGADEALFLNDRGLVTEASGSNVFLVENGVVKTPRLRSGLLPGVTRVAVFDVASKMGLPILEGSVRLAQLQAADEAFLTNSLIEVMPLTAVGGGKVDGGRPGPATRRIMNAYRDLVTVETGRAQ